MEIYIDDKAEYVYEVVGNLHSLYYNGGEQWTEQTRGTVAIAIMDTGDGFVLSQTTPQLKKNNFDYDEALFLTILFKIIHSDHKFEKGSKIEF